MSRISVKIKAARNSVGIKFTMPKLFVPVDCKTPATAKDSMARQLYQAGIISKADYEKMLGVVYDGDFEPDLEDFDDEAFSPHSEFEQSQYANYEDFEDISSEPSVRDDVQPDSSNLSVPDNPSIPPHDGDNVEGKRNDGETK